MPSSWIQQRRTKDGKTRYRVGFRPGGRETKARNGGSFRTMREAVLRQRWIDDELAELRCPDVRAALVEPARVPSFQEAEAAWRASRVDVSDGTRTLHEVALKRCLPRLGAKALDAITAADVNALVTDLAAAGRKKETIRKSLTYLAAVLDDNRIDPNRRRTRPSACRTNTGPRLTRRPPSTSRPSTACSLRATGCLCSSSTQPECGSGSLSG